MRRMRDQGSGSIVNVSSRAHFGTTGKSTYVAIKGAVTSLTYGWALELIREGVRVNALLPGAHTRAHDLALAAGTYRDTSRAIAASPDLVAPASVYLLSELSARITGQAFAMLEDGSGWCNARLCSSAWSSASAGPRTRLRMSSMASSLAFWSQWVLEAEGGLLGELLAKQEISEVLMRFCRAVDRGDIGLIRDCYHPDAYDDHGAYRGDVDGLCKAVEAMLEGTVGTHHSLGQALIEVDGDRATSEAYVIAHHRTRARPGSPEFDLFVGARYVDLFERRGGTWRISRRTVVHSWNRRLAAVEPWRGADAFAQAGRGLGDPTHGGRSPTDPKADPRQADSQWGPTRPAA